MLEQQYEEIMTSKNNFTLFEICQIKDYKRILAASWCILFKWEEINYKLKEVSYITTNNSLGSTNSFTNDYWQDQEDRKLYFCYANLLNLLVSVIISKWFFGRRITVTFITLILALTCDTLITSYRLWLYDWQNYIEIITQNYKDDSIEYVLQVVNISLRNIAYFLICLMGMIEVVKKQQLNSNRNLTAVILCITVGSLKIVQALFLDKFFIHVFDNKSQYWFFAVDNLSTIGAMYLLYPKLVVERCEVNKMNKNN